MWRPLAPGANCLVDGFLSRSFLAGGCVFSFLLDLLLESIVGPSPSPLFDFCLVRLFFVEVRRVVERACLGNLRCHGWVISLARISLKSASASEVARVASHSSRVGRRGSRELMPTTGGPSGCHSLFICPGTVSSPHLWLVLSFLVTGARPLPGNGSRVHHKRVCLCGENKRLSSSL